VPRLSVAPVVVARCAVIALAGALLLAPTVSAASNSRAFLRAPSGPLAPGASVRLTGSVGLQSGQPRCPIGAQVDLLSHAFAAQRDRSLDFAGVPTVLATVHRNGSFATTGHIVANAHACTYTISGRCGGGNLGFDVHLRVS
jgi:hypothetical protein